MPVILGDKVYVSLITKKCVGKKNLPVYWQRSIKANKILLLLSFSGTSWSVKSVESSIGAASIGMEMSLLTDLL